MATTTDTKAAETSSSVDGGCYVAANDDKEPIDEAWITARGAEWDQQRLHWEFNDDSFPLFMWRSKCGPCAWSATIDETPWPCDLWTRGCVRRLLIALQRDLTT